MKQKGLLENVVMSFAVESELREVCIVIERAMKELQVSNIVFYPGDALLMDLLVTYRLVLGEAYTSDIEGSSTSSTLSCCTA